MDMNNVRESSLFGAHNSHWDLGTLTANGQRGVIVKGMKAVILGVTQYRGAVTAAVGDIEIKVGYQTSGDINDASNGTIVKSTAFGHATPVSSWVTWFNKPVVIDLDSIAGRDTAMSLICRYDIGGATSVTLTYMSMWYRVYTTKGTVS